MEESIPLKEDGFDEAVIGLAEVWGIRVEEMWLLFIVTTDVLKY